MFGYYRLASAVPQLRVAEVDYNVDQLTEGFRKAAEQQAAAVVFPELCITGYSCGDLFFQPNLRKAALNGLLRFTEATEGSGTIAVVGLPFLHEDALYNTAAVVQSGRILALVPKTVLPNYREFYEKRQFTSGRELGTGVKEVTINGVHIPFGEEIVFHKESSPFSFGVEICEDLWSVIPPSSKLALLGARAILNPSAGTELTGKAAYRRELVRQQSGRCLCAYVLSSAGVHESTTDTVFGGHSLIADNGRPAAEGERFCRESTLIFADVDFERLEAARLSESSFNDSKFFFPAGNALHLALPEQVPGAPGLEYAFNPARPFLPSPSRRRERCEEIISIQTAGLAKRMEHTRAQRLVIGISGGLDSSLVCAISSVILGKKIRTFAIGMDTDAIDLKYAREAAEFIGADHTEVYMTRKEVLAALPVVIAALGTWDITTIRASMGMYLCCKAIHEKTDIRVLLTGEISDELFGYKYTDFAPSAGAFQQESKKRVDELHMYDVLRADRCISVNSLEARVPFGDLDFVKYVMAVDPALKMNTYGMGKYLLRHAFEKDRLLPDSILWRQKAAFSDAVGHSMVDDLKAYAEEKYTDSEFETRRKQYDYCPPFTKESLLYREIFEQCYPGQARMIRDFWMPNRSWEGCDVDDPSARVLSNYGQSGM